jgi:hypothetical protein
MRVSISRSDIFLKEEKGRDNKFNNLFLFEEKATWRRNKRENKTITNQGQIALNHNFVSKKTPRRLKYSLFIALRKSIEKSNVKVGYIAFSIN